MDNKEAYLLRLTNSQYEWIKRIDNNEGLTVNRMGSVGWHLVDKEAVVIWHSNTKDNYEVYTTKKGRYLMKDYEHKLGQE